MSYNVCIDIGGTFTDCLVADAEGRIQIFKSPTTPGEFHRGFIDVLHVAAAGYELAPADFIKRVSLIVHGSTVSTNALVERKVAQAGVILNEGHADVLTLREGPRKGAFEWRLDYPEPYVSRKFTRTVAGRIDARGLERMPLSEWDVRDAIAHFKKVGVDAIAIGLLWSVVNPAHELRVRDIIREEWPQMPVTLSHELNPIAREYKRIISATIDASISPIIKRYIEDLQGALRHEGFAGELLLANCVGGMMPASEMMRRPIYSVMSGPTLAPIAALALTEEPDVIVGDMGGTTFDVSALRNHQIIITPDAMIHDDALGIPKVDVRSVGAGGGSIAHVDEGGLLQVGPHSAGARPGPACFGQGGLEPTVSDANVVLGIIDPDYFLGGKIKLHRDKAEAAIGKVAARLDVSLLDAAYAVYTTSNHNMVGAIEDITIREGINPRDSFFVCGGGATACHIAEMAEILGLKRYMIPRFMAGLSAFGGLISDVRWEENSTLQTSDAAFDLDGVNDLLGRLRERGRHFLETAKVKDEDRNYEYAFMGRYEYQSWEIEVRFEAPGGRLSLADLPRLVDAFHEMHERIYSIRNQDDKVEMTTWRVKAIGHREKQNAWRDYRLAPHEGAVEPARRRPLYVHADRGLRDVPVYEGERLLAGARLQGPCIVDSHTFSAVLLRGHEGTVDEHGNLVVEVTHA